jgi:hypothetical protein
MFPTQWDYFIRDTIKKQKGAYQSHTPSSNILITLDGDLYIGNMGNFMEWALQEFRYTDGTSNMVYKKIANDYQKNVFNNSQWRSYVFMDICYGENEKSKVTEKVLIELFDEYCPKTAENFRKLCQGFKRDDGQELSYIGTKFSRTVKGMLVQGGKIKGSGPISTFKEGEFADESFQLKHSEPGLLGMCQRNGY